MSYLSCLTSSLCVLRGSEDKPRSLRFTWSMKTTSSMDPQGMMDEIMRVLEAHSVSFEHNEHFLVLCRGRGREAVGVLRLSLNGGCASRESPGNSMAFEQIASKVAIDMNCDPVFLSSPLTTGLAFLLLRFVAFPLFCE